MKVINQTTDWTSGLVKKLIRFQTNPPGLIFRGISRETDFTLEFHPCCCVEKTMNLEEGDEGGEELKGPTESLSPDLEAKVVEAFKV